MILLSACGHRGSVQLAPPQSVDAVKTWKDAVDTAIGPTVADPVEHRNLALSYGTALVMSQYARVRTSLLTGRAASAITADILDLGLTSAVPIVNGARGKTILGAIASGFKGTQLSVDKNLFNQQTTGAILTAMDTCVTRQRKLMDGKRASSAAGYTIYDAYSDLVVLYGCTTLSGAMEELVETQAVAAREQKEKTEPEQFKDVQTAFAKSVTSDKKDAIAFLKAMDVKLPDNPTADQLIDAYRQLGIQHFSDPDFRAKMLAAAKSTGLVK